ncbi:TPA: PTS sugar transporter subunit IIA [candidate division WOR-3 bacterium]|jgi:fructose-specific phosphotransferase system IIA component|uniref:PTS sugar transporter subunit IIA n=1 Tax=candidate division WOR-3 bacterium TaxID=2052148 RepID=A0A350H9J9_UNCW3|nr:PTS sugar transporter subunit IIA [candidate division WOR-3 bacterium]
MEFLYELLNESLVRSDLKSASKSDVIDELAEILVSNEIIKDKVSLMDKLVEREKIETTGVGHGIAIPHARTETVNGLALCFGVSREGIDYDALDGKPVNIFFLIVSNEENKNRYIQLLARISRICRKDSFREKIMNSETEKEIISIFREEEKF